MNTLRAFVWLRWRVFVNSLERTGARDALDRLSIAVEKIGPLVALALLIPSTIVLFIVSVVAGFGLGNGSWLLPFQVVRFFMLAATVLAFFAPIIVPTRSGTNVVRLLLLPIPRGLLYLSSLFGALADPWILLLLPITIGVPVGLAIAARPVAAVVALLGGAGMLLFVLGATSLMSSVIQLLFRDRRRGEVVMLVLVVLLPLIGLLPSVLQVEHSSPRLQETREERRERRRHEPPAPVFAFIIDAGRRVAPSELYQRSTGRAPVEPTRSVLPLAGLFAGAMLLQAVAFAAFARMLDMPMSLGARRAGALGGIWQRRIPGVSAAASAVALTQLRLALRSPRGRSIMIGPVLVVAIFSLLIYRHGEVPMPGLVAASGLGMASFGGFMSLLSLLPVAVNQFAIDRAGFTRQMLAPLGMGELLAGKAIGNLLIATIPGSLAISIPALLFHEGAPALWLTLPLALVATFALVAPIAAALSAVFPKTVDLGSIGSASNAHQAAGFIGLLSCIVCGLPALGLTLLATQLLHRPGFAPVLMIGWCAIALAISWAVFVPVKRLVAARAESISQY